MLGISNTPINIGNTEKGTYRGLFSNWFNGRNVAKEDWMRAEQAQENQLVRDLYFQSKANEFNAQEAQKQRDYDERMSSTQYQRAVEDMKKAGINPVLAVSHGAGFSGGSSATSGGYRTSSGNNAGAGADTSAGNVVGVLLNVAAGLLTKGMSIGASKAVGLAKARQPIQKIIIGK